MQDLRVPAGPGIPRGLIIPAAELHEHFTRSSGPGGQSVNTTDSRVQLRFDIAASAALDERQRTRVLTALAQRLSGTELIVDSAEHRSQLRNRTAARERLAAALRESLAPPPPTRRATKPTRGSQRRRLQTKKRRSQVKAGRGRPRTDD